MAVERTYLDYNASAPLLLEARDAMLAALDQSANASSVHSNGRDARAIIERARKSIADLVGAKADQVIFTSGATEAAQLALSPILNTPSGDILLDHLYISAIEHPCILNGGRFAQAQRTIVPVTTEGVLDLLAFANILANRSSDAPFLMAIMLANNETGILQPVKEVAGLVHNAGGYLLVDAVQAVGRIPIDISDLAADFLILSSHKIGGPQGAGALVLGDKNLKPKPLILGGRQEFQLRAGTENVAAIAGFGAAALLCTDQLDHMQKIVYVRNKFEDQLNTVFKPIGNKYGPITIIGEGVERLANTTCFSVAGINAETALISLDLDGISVSSGSACSSGRVETSHVLMAMGLDKYVARAAIRVSMGWNSTSADTEKFLEAWSSYLRRLT
jgi:cysteine desulfurase